MRNLLPVLYATLGLTAACASAPVGSPFAMADSQAKRAVAMESEIDPSKFPPRSLGILPFSVPAGDTLLQPLGYAMAEFMTTDLSRSTELVVVDRLRMDAILRELELVDKGIVDPRTAPRVGRLVGARRLLIGDVRSTPNGAIEFSARVVDVLDGTVERLVTGSAPLDRAIDAEKILALRVFEALGVSLTPAQRIAVEQRQTSNLAATVAFGQGLNAQARGDAVGAAAAFEHAARLDASFAAARTLATAASVTTRTSSLQRVLSLSAEGINPSAATKLPEAVDAPLRGGQIVALILNVRVF